MDAEQRLVTAESCTGGWIAQVLTDVPGSSNWFLGGIVAYSNTLKQSLLGVLPSTLHAHGAVSEATAREMAIGALETLGGQVAVAVTGIAGPDGAQPGKPVGTVWFGWAWRADGEIETRVALETFSGDREAVRRQTVARVLSELLRAVSHEIAVCSSRCGRRTRSARGSAATAQSHAAARARDRRPQSARHRGFSRRSSPKNASAAVVEIARSTQKLTLDGKFMLHLDRMEFWRRSSLRRADRDASAAGIAEARRRLARRAAGTRVRAARARDVSPARHAGSRRRARTGSCEPSTPVQWPVESFALVESQVGQRGSQYSVLDEWPLA